MATLLEEIRSRKKSDNSQSQESEIPILEEFAPTRTFFGHTPADKKAKPATAEKK